MQLKLDAKTLIAGIALGVAITVAVGAGAGSADADRFGIAVPMEGFAVVRTQDGDFFIVNPETGMATRVLQSRRLNDTPKRSRDDKGRPLNLYGTRGAKRRTEAYPPK